MRVVCDTETDGFEAPTVIWCIVAKDYDTHEVYEFTSDDPKYLEKFRAFAKGVDQWIGHNFLCFDAPVLCKLAGVDIKVASIEDTLILSRLFSPIRQGGHSLARWGRILRQPKQEHDEWDRYSPAMLKRCRTDVDLNTRLYTYLLNEGKGFSNKCRRLEHNVSYILEEAKQYGFKLDEPKARQLFQETYAKSSELAVSIVSGFPPIAKKIKDVTPRYKKDASLSSVGLKWLPDWEQQVGGAFTKIEWQELNLSSPKQVVHRLNMAGWKPIEHTKAGTPKISEPNLETLSDDAPPQAQSIKEYLVCLSRARASKTWLKALGEDGRVHGTILSVGANTHRCAHMDPNTANIPGIIAKSGKVQPYGQWCRECWTVDEGRVLVGADASGMQLRVLAHLMGDPAFTDAVVNGDPHQYNADLANIERPAAKTVIFALLLGAGDALLGYRIGGTRADGKAIKALFLEKIPALDRVRKMMTDYARRGYFPCVDGRLIDIKSAHYALGVALQGIEQAIMKQAIVLWYNRKRKLALDSHLVGFVHDETQLDTIEEAGHTTGQLMVDCIIDAGQILKLNCPLDGDYKIGTTWADTH